MEFKTEQNTHFTIFITLKLWLEIEDKPYIADWLDTYFQIKSFLRETQNKGNKIYEQK